jgi:hypothetical protein
MLKIESRTSRIDDDGERCDDFSLESPDFAPRESICISPRHVMPRFSDGQFIGLDERTFRSEQMHAI